MALLSLRLFSLPATHTWMFLSTAETCLASQRSLGFLLYSYSATGFCQQWYPNLRLDLPHKFKVSFPSRCGVCVQSCSGTEDNKSNKFNVFSSPGSAFFSSLKAWCCWNTLLMLPLQSGVKKGGERRKTAQGVTPRVPSSMLNSAWDTELCNTHKLLTHKWGFYHRAAPDAKESGKIRRRKVIPLKTWSLATTDLKNHPELLPATFPSCCPGSSRYSPCPSGCAA